MDHGISLTKVPAWIVDCVNTLEAKAAFLTMASMAMSMLEVDQVKEISTPRAWEGLAWYTGEMEEELMKMREASEGRATER